MDDLLSLSQKKIAKVPLGFKRYLLDKINWTNRLIGIKGARGTGKTTMLLQWLNLQKLPTSQVAYFSLDELYFTKHSLVDTAQIFYNQGGKVLALDEVHKYPTWAQEIKNLYDRYEDLHILFSGSSIIDIARQEGDLSRRAVMYELRGLSYREYLNFRHQLDFTPLSLHQLLENTGEIQKLFDDEFKPLAFLKDYFKFGYYPFYESDAESYHMQLRQLTRTIVETDMSELQGFDIRHARKMMQLIYVVAQQVPFKPNITALAAKTGLHRNSVNNYLYFLNEARLIHLLYSPGNSVSTLQKPEKVYLDNPNLLYALAESLPLLGTVREVFFASQVSVTHRIFQGSLADFVVDSKYHFEIGGRTKGTKQIAHIPEGWIVKDDLDFPIGRSIPLWMFGFLY